MRQDTGVWIMDSAAQNQAAISRNFRAVIPPVTPDLATVPGRAGSVAFMKVIWPGRFPVTYLPMGQERKQQKKTFFIQE